MENKKKLFAKLLPLSNLFKSAEKDNIDFLINNKFLPSWIINNPSFEGVDKVLNSGYPCGWQKTTIKDKNVVHYGCGYIKCKPEMTMTDENLPEDALVYYEFTIQALKDTGEVSLANFNFNVLDEDLDMELCSYPKKIIFQKFNKPKTVQLRDEMLFSNNIDYILDVNQIIRVMAYDSVYCEYDLLSYSDDNRVGVKIDKAYILYYDDNGNFFNPLEDEYDSFEIVGQMKTSAAEIAENTLKVWGFDSTLKSIQKQEQLQDTQEYEMMFQ
jgi:hypothetical protein